MQALSPLVLLASLTPVWWASGMVPVAAVLGTLLRFRLPTAAAFYFCQLAIRKLPVYFSVPLVIVVMIAWFLLLLTLVEINGDFDDDESSGTQPHGSFEKLQNKVPRGCTDAAVAAVLSASNYYEVCVSCIICACCTGKAESGQ